MIGFELCGLQVSRLATVASSSWSVTTNHPLPPLSRCGPLLLLLLCRDVYEQCPLCSIRGRAGGRCTENLPTTVVQWGTKNTLPLQWSSGHQKPGLSCGAMQNLATSLDDFFSFICFSCFIIGHSFKHSYNSYTAKYNPFILLFTTIGNHWRQHNSRGNVYSRCRYYFSITKTYHFKRCCRKVYRHWQWSRW